MLLGVVLAGGLSSRFGSDKALAELDGHSLLSLAVDALSGWCDKVVDCGRELAPAPTLPDWPRAGMGPLGGLAAALRLACDEGYEQVLSCGVDAAFLPDNLAGLLEPAPCCLADQPVIGLWAASAAPVIERLLLSDERHSMQHFAQLCGARMIRIDQAIPNINRPEDLAALGGNAPPA